VTPQPWFLVAGVLFILTLLGGLLLIAVVGCAAARVGWHLLAAEYSHPDTDTDAVVLADLLAQLAACQAYERYGAPWPDPAPTVETGPVVDVVAVTRRSQGHQR
jgi:hypothetical protein